MSEAGILRKYCGIIYLTMCDISASEPKSLAFSIYIQAIMRPDMEFMTELIHYTDVIMGTIASQITSLTLVYATVYSGADQRIHQSSASLAFPWGVHRGPVNSSHKWPVTRKMSPFDDVIMNQTKITEEYLVEWSNKQWVCDIDIFIPSNILYKTLLSSIWCHWY